MKTISILIPCYNEEENVVPIYNAIIDIIKKDLSSYEYEIVFIDNCSTDKTGILLRELCAENCHVKTIFNTKNFGPFSSPFYGMLQTNGDCTIVVCADFQDPPELIPVFVHEWECGYKIVAGIKTKSRENKLLRFLRTCYYKIIKRMSPIDQIEHFTGFGLYDKSFLDILRNLHDPVPFLRGIVAELGFKRKDIQYEQQKRRFGKTHTNWYSLYDAAMLSFTSYTKIGLRIATIIGFVVAIISFVIACVYLVYKLLYWDMFVIGTAPIVIGIFFLGSLQLFFTGFIGEYIMSINIRVMNRPLVIEEERINFDK
jgi:glycosyltransferase involved in cell wall biosynthesis